jgi:23S rRNA (cytosine1962-C5)-methyltransferase
MTSPDLAPPVAALPAVRLKIARRSSHPWVFQKMVERPATRLPPGSVVDVLDRDGQWVGRGLYNGHSRISLRVLTAEPGEAIDDAFFARRIRRAAELRRDWLGLDAVTDAYRLVHSEGDGLSGLVVDRFGSTLVLEFFAAGMYRFRTAIQAALAGHYPGCRFYWFAEEHVQKQESFDCRPPEAPPAEVITENGVRFRVAPGSKHKTGFFLDQRDNRQALASFCAGKRVLDLCCNTGGFAVYAKARGAEEVVGVDLDEQALALARQNAGLNGVRVRFVQADLFPWLRDVIAAGQRFDVVVLDPAKQTRDREEVAYALKRYLDMNRLALQAVAPGGLLLTCSCTGLVGEADFLETLRRAAWQAGRTVQVLRVSGAGADHPFLVHVPEGRYLKAVFCRVEGESQPPTRTVCDVAQ